MKMTIKGIYCRCDKGNLLVLTFYYEEKTMKLGKCLIVKMFCVVASMCVSDAKASAFVNTDSLKDMSLTSINSQNVNTKDSFDVAWNFCVGDACADKMAESNTADEPTRVSVWGFVDNGPDSVC